MTFYVETLDKVRHTFDLFKIGENANDEDIKRFIERELKITFFDISWEYPLGDESIIEVIYPCKDISEEEKEKYFDFLDEYELYNNIYIFASYFGHIKCLKYAYENRYKDIQEVHRGCLSLFEKDREFNYLDNQGAIKNGHLDCLEYIYKNGYKKYNFEYGIAVSFGHLECLEYLHKIGCKWDNDTCQFAASNGHLDCLKYAHENGCGWDEWTCFNAAADGHLDCLIYARENGCEWDKKDCLSFSEEYPYIQEWIKNN